MQTGYLVHTDHDCMILLSNAWCRSNAWSNGATMLLNQAEAQDLASKLNAARESVQDSLMSEIRAIEAKNDPTSKELRLLRRKKRILENEQAPGSSWRVLEFKTLSENTSLCYYDLCALDLVPRDSRAAYHDEIYEKHSRTLFFR